MKKIGSKLLLLGLVSSWLFFPLLPTSSLPRLSSFKNNFDTHFKRVKRGLKGRKCSSTMLAMASLATLAVAGTFYFRYQPHRSKVPQTLPSQPAPQESVSAEEIAYRNEITPLEQEIEQKTTLIREKLAHSPSVPRTYSGLSTYILQKALNDAETLAPEVAQLEKSCAWQEALIHKGKIVVILQQALNERGSK